MKSVVLLNPDELLFLAKLWFDDVIVRRRIKSRIDLAFDESSDHGIVQFFIQSREQRPEKE